MSHWGRTFLACVKPCVWSSEPGKRKEKSKEKKAAEIPGARILIIANKEKQQGWADGLCKHGHGVSCDQVNEKSDTETFLKSCKIVVWCSLKFKEAGAYALFLKADLQRLSLCDPVMRNTVPNVVQDI